MRPTVSNKWDYKKFQWVTIRGRGLHTCRICTVNNVCCTMQVFEKTVHIYVKVIAIIQSSPWRFIINEVHAAWVYWLCGHGKISQVKGKRWETQPDARPLCGNYICRSNTTDWNIQEREYGLCQLASHISKRNNTQKLAILYGFENATGKLCESHSRYYFRK